MRKSTAEGDDKKKLNGVKQGQNVFFTIINSSSGRVSRVRGSEENLVGDALVSLSLSI
jgi:hypothetical protein